MESFFKIVKICFKDKYRKYQVISSRGYLRDIILLFNHDYSQNVQTALGFLSKR
jgi:hypothetical protein